MIELLPRHKTGLPLASPVMIAAGFAGFGDAWQRLLDLSVFGAVVTQPVTLRPQRGLPQPRLAELEGGLILNTGGQNPGVKKVLSGYSRLWGRLPTRVIAHLPAARPDDLQRTARALAGNAPLAALELDIPPHAHPYDVADWVAAVFGGSELPLLARLPFSAAPEIVEAAVAAGVDGLVISAPPEGAAETSEGQLVVGSFFGRAAHPLALAQVQVIARGFDVPLVAAGGIHTTAQARALLAAGAAAVQLDSLLLQNPRRAEEIARELAAWRQ
ncbi:MAG: dihydroorotate dehydrogenase [Anaerolineae bacterium]